MPKFDIVILPSTNVFTLKTNDTTTVINKETRELRVPLYLSPPTNSITGCHTFLFPADNQAEFQIATAPGTSLEIVLIIYVT